MQRLHIRAVQDAHSRWLIADSPNGSGLEQIAAFARRLGSETGDRLVQFEIFWPWETTESQTYDAVEVDLDALERWDGKNEDPAEPWVRTLPACEVIDV